MSAPQRPGLAGLDQIGQLPGYGQFTGYAPVPGAQGAYLFDLVNGGKVPFSGAPAEDLRTKIDAARGYQPGDAARAFGGGASPGQAPAAPAQSNKFDPLVSTKGGGELGVRSGGDPANPMDYVVRTPGRAATKGGMAARGMTSQGGYNLDPQFIEDMDRSNQETQAITTQAVKEGAQLAAKKQAYFERLQAQTENEAAVAAHENAVKQQRFGEMQAKLDKAEQDYINTPAEQEAARNTPKAKLATFLGALSSAFGALGASLARTPNFAAEAIARHNEMQIRREEAELRVKKDTKDSMLGQLQQQLGSMELARSAYRSILAKQSALGLEALAQKEGDQQRQTSILQTAELQQRAALKEREAYNRGAEGEVTRTFQYVPGQSGSRGGYRAPTIDELQGLQGLRKGEVEIDKTRAEATRGTGPEREIPHERSTAIEAMVGAINAADRIEKNLTDRGEGADNTLDNPLAGSLDAIRRGASALVGGDRAKADAQLEADTFSLARGIQQSLGKSDNDAKLAESAAVGNGSSSDRIRAARQARERNVASLRTEFGALPPSKQRQLLESLPPDAQAAIRGEQ